MECFDVQAKANCFSENLWKLYQCHCPLKTKVLSLKSCVKPWLTSDLKCIIKFKQFLFKQYKSGTIHFERHNSFKNNVSSHLKSAKNKYFISKFKHCQSDVKATWKTINFLLNKKNNAITSVDSGRREVESPGEWLMHSVSSFRLLLVD